MYSFATSHKGEPVLNIGSASVKHLALAFYNCNAADVSVVYMMQQSTFSTRASAH